MKAAIYNPYLDTLGGGERYTMAVAQVLSNNGYMVDVEWKDSSIKEKLENRFGINLENINFIPSIKRGDGYDVCFWVSDGSIPTLRSRKNLLHFQVPFHGVNGKTLLNRMKLFRINKIVCNSQFTKKVIDEEYGVKSVVLYPPVDVLSLKPKRKENFILSVGRFSQLKQAKRQDILIDAFKKFYDRGNHDWKLVLAGGAEVGANEYIENLEKKTTGYPIKIMKSPDFKTIKELYGTAKIFWSAAGYSINEEREPEKVEHFGISVVEAMSAGTIPFAYSAGGHKEVIQDGVNGYLWETISELVRKSEALIKSKKIFELSKKTKETSLRYSYSEFAKRLKEFI
jgi:glycosyltransferase involved in cell wall biosynthesis